MARVPNRNRLGVIRPRGGLGALGLQHGDPVYDQYGQFMYNYMDPAVVANPGAYAPPPPPIAFYIPPAPGAAPTPNTAYGYVAPPPPTVVYSPTAQPNSGASFGGGSGPTPAPPPQTAAPVATPAPSSIPKAAPANAPYYFNSDAASAAGQAYRAYVIPRAGTAQGMAEIVAYMRANNISAQLAAAYMNPQPGDTLQAATARVVANLKAAGYNLDANGIPIAANRALQIKNDLSKFSLSRPDLILQYINDNDVTYEELRDAMGWSKSQVDQLVTAGYNMLNGNGGTSAPPSSAPPSSAAPPPSGGGSVFGGGTTGGGNSFAPGEPTPGDDDNTMLLFGLGAVLIGGVLFAGGEKKSRSGGRRRVSRRR